MGWCGCGKIFINGSHFHAWVFLFHSSCVATVGEFMRLHRYERAGSGVREWRIYHFVYHGVDPSSDEAAQV